MMLQSSDTLQRNLPQDTTVQTSPVVVVDVAIVCSKEFIENFGSNREEIPDFFSAYFFDIKMQFQQLPRSRISFSVTSLTLIKSKEEQPFIEELRDPKFGNASLARILPHFANWISNKRAQLPGHDMAILVTEPGLDKTATGAAPLGGMCRASIDNSGLRITNAVVVLDGTLTAGSHQIAHLLEVPYDDEMKMCENGKCNMNRENGTTRTIPQFSPSLADQYIAKFIYSDRSTCLKMKSPRVPLIDPDFDSVLPPSIGDQCGLLSGNRNTSAIPINKENECGLVQCKGHHSSSSILISPLSNFECGNGWRCFHGRCFPSGLLMFHVGTGKCLMPKEASLKSGVKEIAMSNCPRSSNPYERFHIASLNRTSNKLLVSPCKPLSSSYSDGDGTEHQCMDQCLSATQTVGGFAKLKKCNATDDLQKWSLLDQRDFFMREIGYYDFEYWSKETGFLLYNVGAKSCLTPRLYKNPVESSETDFHGVNETLFLHTECNTADANFRWRSLPVLPPPRMCRNSYSCRAGRYVQVRRLLNTTFSCSSNRVSLTVTLENVFGLAMAPAALISWKSNLTLTTKPENCVWIQSGLKCKIGRLLNVTEKSLAAELEFDAENMSLIIDDRKLNDQFNITVKATVGRVMFFSFEPVATRRERRISSSGSDDFDDTTVSVMRVMMSLFFLYFSPLN